jgi:hypothetical protein
MVIAACAMATCAATPGIAPITETTAAAPFAAPDTAFTAPGDRSVGAAVAMKGGGGSVKERSWVVVGDCDAAARGAWPPPEGKSDWGVFRVTMCDDVRDVNARGGNAANDAVCVTDQAVDSAAVPVSDVLRLSSSPLLDVVP